MSYTYLLFSFFSSAPWLGAEVEVDRSSDGKGDNRSSASGELARARTSSRGSSRSAGTGTLAGDDDSDEDSMALDPPDVRIRCYDQHTDSVYAVAWSQADAWSFCSVSYDGRVAVNHVPSSEKYKILL